MKDDLNTLFDSYRPELGDADEYMERLHARMKAVETVKRYANEQCRLYRRRMVAAFITGVVLGAAAIVYILLNPIVPKADMSRLAMWLVKIYPVLLALLVAALSIGLAMLVTRQPQTDSNFSRSTP